MIAVIFRDTPTECVLQEVYILTDIKACARRSQETPAQLSADTMSALTFKLSFMASTCKNKTRNERVPVSALKMVVIALEVDTTAYISGLVTNVKSLSTRGDKDAKDGSTDFTLEQVYQSISQIHPREVL